MSRLSALKEHTFMTALHAAGFPVPTPLAWNRHTVVMSLVEGTPLYQIRHLEEYEARRLYGELMAMIVRLAGVGLIHGDFNEFNIMIEECENSSSSSKQSDRLPPDTEKSEQDDGRQDDTTTTTMTTTVTLHPILIDFPQMLSISHPNASTYFDRDVDCIKRYFSRRFHFTSDDPGPFFKDVQNRMRTTKGVRRLDVEVEASGFSKKMAKELERYMEDIAVNQTGSDVDSNPDDSGDSDSSDDGSPEIPSGHEFAVTHISEEKEAFPATHEPDEGSKQKSLNGIAAVLGHISVAEASSTSSA